MENLLKFCVSAEMANRRLDRLLWTQLSGLSRMRITSLLAAGACTVNRAVVAAGGYHVRTGDLVEVKLSDITPTAMTPEPLEFEIIHEDDYLLVVVKPAGMLVHPTRGVKSGTLINGISYHLNRLLIEERAASSVEPQKPTFFFSSASEAVRPGMVHRLDQATSGLMVIAKEQRALTRLSDHFRRRLVAKRYLALVRGCVAEDDASISAPIDRDPEAHPKWRVMEGGKPSETRLRVLERTSGMTYVELEPVTGRTNQLRIHCAHRGHPIVGDEWYGTSEKGRLCLHAAHLAFHHPAGGEWVEFTSPLPAEIGKIFGG